MNAFYFFGITEFQDMLSVLLELLKRGEKCWVCFFDCLKSKRQFYYYSKEELFDFIDRVCKVNNLPVPAMDFFGQEDRVEFEKKYDGLRPELIFMQSVFHKYPLWMPIARLSKIIHFCWGLDGLQNLRRSGYENIVLNVLRHEEDVNSFRNIVGNFQYFGSFWEEQINHNFSIPDVAADLVMDKKICFIPETWICRTHNGSPVKWNKTNVGLIDDVMEELRAHDFFIIVKKREKGYPVDMINGFSNYLAKKPDFIIDKDLYCPSSLFYFPMHSRLCLLIGHKTQGTMALYKMYKKMNQNTMMCEYNDCSLEKILGIIRENANYDLKQSKIIQQNETPSQRLIDYKNEQIY